jgi:hypothetical protein
MNVDLVHMALNFLLFHLVQWNWEVSPFPQWEEQQKIFFFFGFVSVIF